jgi:membrane-associated phospholipid phosphatase
MDVLGGGLFGAAVAYGLFAVFRKQLLGFS